MIMDNIAKVRPMTAQDQEALVKAAERDNHPVFAPTHVVEKHETIVGYLSLGVIPTVILWLDSKEVKAIDSVVVGATFENIMRAQGFQNAIVLCDKTSPFHSKMEKTGYTVLTGTDAFVKKL